MVMYIYNLPDWPQFRWSQDKLASKLAAVRHRQGRLIGRMEGLGFRLRAEAVLQSLTEETLKSSKRKPIPTFLGFAVGCDSAGSHFEGRCGNGRVLIRGS